MFGGVSCFAWLCLLVPCWVYFRRVMPFSYGLLVLCRVLLYLSFSDLLQLYLLASFRSVQCFAFCCCVRLYLSKNICKMFRFVPLLVVSIGCCALKKLLSGRIAILVSGTVCFFAVDDCCVLCSLWDDRSSQAILGTLPQTSISVCQVSRVGFLATFGGAGWSLATSI